MVVRHVDLIQTRVVSTAALAVDQLKAELRDVWQREFFLPALVSWKPCTHGLIGPQELLVNRQLAVYTTTIYRPTNNN